MCFLLAMGASEVHASFQPNWDRPLYTGKMKVTMAQRGFEGVRSAKLTLTRRDGSATEGPTGMTLQYTVPEKVIDSKYFPSHNNYVTLVVNKTEVDSCGSRQYIASLPQDEESRNPRRVGARFGIVLTDHSQRVCEDYRPNLWEASVHQGFGWCGTDDSRMQLSGNPEPVVTIKKIISE